MRLGAIDKVIATELKEYILWGWSNSRLGAAGDGAAESLSRTYSWFLWWNWVEIFFSKDTHTHPSWSAVWSRLSLESFCLFAGSQGSKGVELVSILGAKVNDSLGWLSFTDERFFVVIQLSWG